ncbi:MAG: response regulator [Bdellovibrionales bacterium]|nr:response regulator [Bdellovibrionales bacterium]
MAVLSILLACLGLALDQPIIVGLSFLVLCTYVYFLRRDLRIIDRALEGKDALTRKRFLDSSQIKTSEGRKTLTEILALRYRLANLEWESKTEDAQNTPLLDESKIAETSTGQPLTQSEYCEALVSSIASRFRAKAVAISFVVDNRRKLFLSKQLGARFERSVQAYLENPTGGWGKSVIESYDKELGSSGLALAGIRYHLSYPIFTQEDGTASDGVLWLGYDISNAPSVTEQRWAKALAGRIGLAIRSREKLARLYGEVKQAQASENQREQYLANLSHDIRTPLNNVKNILTLVKLERPESEDSEMLEAALDNCGQMGDLIDDILDYSRHKLGSLTSSPKDVWVSQALDSLVRGFASSAELKHLKVTIGELDRDLVIRFDQKHFRRILSNLISNAIKYTPFGSVEVSAKAISSSRCRISVSDTGIGLTEAQQEKLFAPFTRFNDKLADGVGLGLALSRILAEVNNADLGFCSEYGKGSVFWLEANIAETKQETIPKNDRLDIGPKNLVDLIESMQNCSKILVVDDDRDSVDVLSRSLSQVGFSVLSAYGVPEAVGILRMERPDLVVTDADMPHGGGNRIIEVAYGEYNLPVVVVSGHESESNRADLERLGAKAYFVKPIELRELLETIDRLTKNQDIPLSKIGAGK